MPAILMSVGLILFVLLKLTARPNERPNGFSRQWGGWEIDSTRSLEHDGTYNGISGTTKEYVYFSTVDPRWIIRMTIALNRSDSVAFGLPFGEKMKGVSKTVVEPPSTFLFANNFPGVFRGRWDIREFDTLYSSPTTFTRSARMPPSHVLLRSFDSTGADVQVLQKINIKSGKVEAVNQLFENQKFGGIDRDGLIVYDSLLKRVFYVEQYRNKFYCLDTLLRPIYTASTIDTFEVNAVEIKWMNMEGERRLMPSKPRTIINGDCYIDDSLLFVRSQLRSDDQSIDEFKNNAVFDIYRTIDGKYVGSFQVPLWKKDGLLSFSIEGNLLVALSSRRINVFKFKSKLGRTSF